MDNTISDTFDELAYSGIYAGAPDWYLPLQRRCAYLGSVLGVSISLVQFNYYSDWLRDHRYMWE